MNDTNPAAGTSVAPKDVEMWIVRDENGRIYVCRRNWESAMWHANRRKWRSR